MFIKNKKGMTVIETVIATSVFMMASIIIVSLFVSHTQLFRIQEEVGSLKLNKTIFTKQFRETGEAASAVAPSYSIGGALYNSSTSTIIFKVPGIDETGTNIENQFD